jgi:hypothetical protein
MMKYGSQRMDQASQHCSNGHSTTPLLTDIWDGDVIAQLKERYPDFFTNPNHLALSLAADGFLVWNKKAGKTDKETEKSKSTWPINVTINNLPPEVRSKLGATAPLGFTPMAHMHDIQPFLEPLVDELLLLWNGVDMHNASTGKTEHVRAVLVAIIADYPALAKLLGRYIQPTPEGCFFCEERGVWAWAGKVLYGGFWRWIAEPAQRAIGRLLNYKPLQPPANNPTPACEPAVNTPKPAARTLDQLRPTVDPVTGLKTPASDKLKHCVFWELPYFDPTIMASYDAMHTLGGLVKDLFMCMAAADSVNVQLYERTINK